MAPKARIRPYKDFLTPLLHRRFALATATLCMLCYLESLIIGEWKSWFWSWFPFGRAGIRTGLLFIPAFSIFILRVAQLHVGIRTSFSAWQTFTTYSPKFHAIQTIGWYFFSAWLYSEIYIWSIPKDADLNRIKLIPKTDRPILNERPIYFTTFLLFLAFVQAGIHLFYDYDRIDMPVQKISLKGAAKDSSPVEPPPVLLKKRLPTLLASSLKRVVAVAVLSPFLYSIGLPFYPYSIRRFAWNFTRSWAKVFWSLPKSNALPSIRPFHWSLLVRTVTSGFLLLMLWEVGNAAFSAYVSQEPLKNERPITYESRDPNGSLLTGLNGKKLQTRAFAFWELVYISERFEGRRKAIFEDIDRAGGSTWSQIRTACLDTIGGINIRITEYQSPTKSTAGAAVPATAEEIPSLPRLGKPIKDGVRAPGDIFTSPPPPKSTGPAMVQVVSDFSKKHGQSPPGSSPRSRKLLESAGKAVLAPTQGVASSRSFDSVYREWLLSFLKSQFGWPFRQEYRRRMAAVVLGTPYGDVGIIVDAIDSLTRLAVCSLKEDKYGNVQRDLKLIIQTFTNTINKLEAFKTNLGAHWTDVEKRVESPEADIILNALKSGLNQLVETFEGYSEDLRLSQTEMRMAREAMTTPVR